MENSLIITFAVALRQPFFLESLFDSTEYIFEVGPLDIRLDIDNPTIDECGVWPREDRWFITLSNKVGAKENVRKITNTDDNSRRCEGHGVSVQVENLNGVDVLKVHMRPISNFIVQVITDSL